MPIRGFWDQEQQYGGTQPNTGGRGPVTVDNASGVVYPTIDPGVVKQKVSPGDALPNNATLADINGQTWAYYPTDTAIAMGKLQAALDTVSAIPAQIEQQLTDAAKAAKGALSGATIPVLIGIGIFVLIEVMQRKARR